MTGSGSGSSSPAANAPYRYADGVLTLHVHVQPGAAHSGWAGRHGAGALKLRLTARAVEGKANRACVDWLAAAAHVPRSAVRIVRGERARDKVIRIGPLSEAQFRELQRQWQD